MIFDERFIAAKIGQLVNYLAVICDYFYNSRKQILISEILYSRFTIVLGFIFGIGLELSLLEMRRHCFVFFAMFCMSLSANSGLQKYLQCRLGSFIFAAQAVMSSSLLANVSKYASRGDNIRLEEKLLHSWLISYG